MKFNDLRTEKMLLRLLKVLYTLTDSSREEGKQRVRLTVAGRGKQKKARLSVSFVAHLLVSIWYLVVAVITVVVYIVVVGVVGFVAHLLLSIWYLVVAVITVVVYIVVVVVVGFVAHLLVRIWYLVVAVITVFV